MVEDIQELEKIRKAGRTSIKEGSAAAIMEGFGNRYITPYALTLGASNFFIGLISTLPILLGNLFQLHTLSLLKTRKRKTIVYISTFIQSLFWLPLILIGMIYLIYSNLSPIFPILLLIIYSIIVISGAVASPAWNSWMKDLIIKDTGKYFGIRNRVVNLVIILSMFTAGIILNFFNQRFVLLGFSIIFFIAMIGRLISSYLLFNQYEPNYTYSKESHYTLKSFIKRIPKSNFGLFVVFISLTSFAISIASPFFAVYMLKNLNFNYIQFTIVTISSIISTILFMPSWGKFADKYGNIKVLKITGFLIPIIPFLWIMTIFLISIPVEIIVLYLLIIELFSGFVWSGFNLSSAIFIYDAVSREKMAVSITYFNILNSLGAFIGAIIGGLIASLKLSLFNLDTLIFIFLLSGILRIIIAISFGNKIKEVRIVSNLDFKEKIKRKLKDGQIFIWRYIGLKPIRIT